MGGKKINGKGTEWRQEGEGRKEEIKEVERNKMKEGGKEDNGKRKE